MKLTKIFTRDNNDGTISVVVDFITDDMARAVKYYRTLHEIFSLDETVVFDNDLALLEE